MALISPSLKLNFSNPKIPKLSNPNPTVNLLRPLIPSLPSKTPTNYQLCPWKTLISTSRSYRNLTASSSLRFLESDEDVGSSPWEGAVIYRRDSAVTHLEYCTTLERLGLEKLSSELSRSRASDMGLRVTKGVKDYPHGTPVLISVDVTRKKKKLKLDGIIRTVITLGCNRCAEPATECTFSNFTFLLTEEPIEEPDKIFMGNIFGDDKFNTSGGSSEEVDEDSIDLDDQFYFPAEEKEIDISKQIRDMIHVEITINAICNANCKGLCLKCGVNLNKGRCNCSKQKAEGKDMVFSET
ncbi:large ribosomal RNA subunit accumulation protein YCED homolog 1, chloroplastic [Magnolia sinica]|uniref:large ribosomal RNA subunit accumulation protein YCED homolog 1, chloroplastic n=1 Tax=Magnolia sinica TaxID=86752 RepID=UPI002657E50C|nr:large ribosomal RNA subunit accumulation protein YCED homolog 1, chloroplastic [Magnolia sinica]